MPRPPPKRPRSPTPSRELSVPRPPPPAPLRLPLELLGGDAAPLRLILVGNNPSEATAAAGIPYAHRSNRFWSLLTTHVTRAAGGAPPTPASAAALPAAAGVGLLDVGAGVVGTRLAAFTSAHFAAWAPAFYARLAAHAAAAAAAVGCTCGGCGAPAIVATTGKRQWQELLAAGGRRLPRVEFGEQPPGLRPAGWPLPATTRVFVLASTSGAAALTNEARAAPWARVGAEVARLAWPRPVACRPNG